MRRDGELPESNRSNSHLLAALALPAEPEYPHRKISLDLEMLRNSGYLPEKGQERRLADFYRQIKRPLIETALENENAPEARLTAPRDYCLAREM